MVTCVICILVSCPVMWYIRSVYCLRLLEMLRSVVLVSIQLKAVSQERTDKSNVKPHLNDGSCLPMSKPDGRNLHPKKQLAVFGLKLKRWSRKAMWWRTWSFGRSWNPVSSRDAYSWASHTYSFTNWTPSLDASWEEERFMKSPSESNRKMKRAMLQQATSRTLEVWHCSFSVTAGVIVA